MLSAKRNSRTTSRPIQTIEGSGWGVRRRHLIPRSRSQGQVETNPSILVPPSLSPPPNRPSLPLACPRILAYPILCLSLGLKWASNLGFLSVSFDHIPGFFHGFGTEVPSGAIFLGHGSNPLATPSSRGRGAWASLPFPRLPTDLFSGT